MDQIKRAVSPILPGSGRVLAEYVRVLECLSKENLEQLSLLLDDDVRFIDPFNDVIGKDQFIGVMAEMFEKLEGVRFEVIDSCERGSTGGWLYWRFSASSKITGPFSVEGSSRLLFNPEGQVSLHHDFWDASLMMQQVPVLGKVIASIRNRAAYSPSS